MAAAVYGPVEVKHHKMLIDKAHIEVIYKPKCGISRKFDVFDKFNFLLLYSLEYWKELQNENLTIIVIFFIQKLIFVSFPFIHTNSGHVFFLEIGDRLFESIIGSICETAILSSFYPRTAIYLIIQELQDCGAVSFRYTIFVFLFYFDIFDLR